MENNLVESRSEFSFHLDGESEIDASLLANTIRDIAEITKETAHEIDPEAYLKMNVTAFRNGSFQIDFSTVCAAAETLLTSATPAVMLAGNVISSLKGIFEIKKFLKGKKPKEISKGAKGKVKIRNEEGNQIEVPASSQIVIHNERIDQLVVNISNYSQEHNQNGGFSIITGDEALRCSASDIREMSKPLPPETEITTCIRSKIKTMLLIRKAVLIGNAKWSFDYNGRAIDASVEDEVFVHNFQLKESIRSGDYIEAIMEIYVDLDKNGDQIKGTEKYTVLQVFGGIRHGKDESQIELNLT